MAAGILPAASPKKDDYEYTKATESSYKLPAVSQSTKSFSFYIQPSFKKTKKTKTLLPCCFGRTVSQADWLACPI